MDRFWGATVGKRSKTFFWKIGQKKYSRLYYHEKLYNMKRRLVCYLLILFFGSGCFHNSTILVSSSFINTNNDDVGIEEIQQQNENDLERGIFKLKCCTAMKQLIVLRYLNLRDVFMLRSTCKFFQDLVIIEENEIKSICDEPMVNGLSFGKVNN